MSKTLPRLRRSLLGLAAAALLCAMAPGAALASDLLPFLSAEGGYQLSHVTYKESSVNVKEEGWLHGLYGRLTMHAPLGLMLRAEADASQGKLDYDGTTWGGDPLTGNGTDRVVNARLLAGLDLSFGAWAITPYAGLGWRYWYDKQDGSGFYTRETTYAYLPLGAEMNMRLAQGWRLRMQGEVEVFLKGKNKSRLSEADPTFNDVEMDQGQGLGWMASVGLAREMGLFALRVEPFIQYWDVKQSDYATLYWNGLRAGRVFEPDNTTTTWGLRLTVEF